MLTSFWSNGPTTRLMKQVRSDFSVATCESHQPNGRIGSAWLDQSNLDEILCCLKVIRYQRCGQMQIVNLPKREKKSIRVWIMLGSVLMIGKKCALVWELKIRLGIWLFVKIRSTIWMIIFLGIIICGSYEWLSYFSDLIQQTNGFLLDHAHDYFLWSCKWLYLWTIRIILVVV